MAIAHAAWIHGHSVNATRPELASAIRREGPGARIDMRSREDNWFQFAIPTPVIVADRRLRAESVLLNFSTGEGAYISNVHIYDGDNVLARFDDLQVSSGPGVWQMERWRLPEPREVFLAIGVSVKTTYGLDRESRPGPAETHVFFGAAGCDFV